MKIYDIYNNYKIYIYIKKLKATKIKFKNSFTLYYHSFYNTNWTIDSYKKIYTFNNLASFYMLFNNIDFSSGMFFLMKNSIQPIYEDKANRKGGYMSIKIQETKLNNIWLYLILDFISDNLSNKNIINGLSINYKRKYFIMKIWIRKKKYNHSNNLNLSYIKKNSIIYNNF